METKIYKGVFAILGIACIVGILAAGAWWHLGTLAICYFMYSAYNEEEETEDVQ